MTYNFKIQSLLKFTNLLVKKGNKNKAITFLIKTLFLIKKKTKKNPINSLYSAIKTLTPGVSTKKTIVAGRLYHLPCAISNNKALYFGCHWFQESALNTKEGTKANNFSTKLYLECLKVLNKKGNAMLFLKQHNKSVSENRPFLRFVKRKYSLRLPRKMFLRKRKNLYLKRFKKKIIFNRDDDFNDIKYDSYFRPITKYNFDTKYEEKFQSKIDSRFNKIDKKREIYYQIKNNVITKTKVREPKNKNKKFNRKN